MWKPLECFHWKCLKELLSICTLVIVLRRDGRKATEQPKQESQLDYNNVSVAGGGGLDRDGNSELMKSPDPVCTRWGKSRKII